MQDNERCFVQTSLRLKRVWKRHASHKPICFPAFPEILILHSLQVFLDRGLKILHCLDVTFLDRMVNAVFEMFVNDLLTEPVQGRADGGELDEDFGTVFVGFQHALDVFQMPDDPRDAVDFAALYLRIMYVRM